MIKLAKNRAVEPITMREAYGQTLMRLGEEDERVVVLDTDLVFPMGLLPFKERFPDRLYDCGIMESHMIGTAAGLSVRELIPFAHTFCCFMSRRVLDQVYLSLCYAGLNAKLIGTDPGITALFNGGTHMGLEDMGHLIGIPNITLLDPSDTVMFADLLGQIKDLYGVQYIRLNRKRSIKLYEEGSHFEIGKGIVLEEGRDVTIMASGLMVEQSLLAAELLKKEGIRARVVDMFTWKPLDRDLVLACAEETGAIVTAENHSVMTGLGAAVARVLCLERPTPMGYIGIQNRFGEVGDYDYLLETFGMTAADIADEVKRTLKKKR